MLIKTRLGIYFHPPERTILGQKPDLIATVALFSGDDLLEQLTMACPIVGVNVIGEAGPDSLVELETGHRGPGGVQKGAAPGVIHLENDFFDVFDDRFIFELAGSN